MNITVFHVLVGVAGVLSIVALIKPAWPILAVAVFLVCVALFVGNK